MVFGFLTGSCMSRTPPQEEPRFGPVRLPLYHTKGAPNEGVFKCTLHIGGNPIDVIIDSCSADLIVVGQQCNSSCQHTAGEYPKNKGTYTGRMSTVGYVSQSNTVAWAQDKLEFLSDLLAGSNSKAGSGSGPGPLAVSMPAASFGVVVKNVSHVVQGGTMPGRSIVGLMSPQRHSGVGLGLLDEKDTQSFINQVFGKRGIFKKSIYSIAIEPNGDAGEIILGGVHKGIKGWVPLVTAKEYPLLSYSPQWVIRIRRALAVAYDGTILANLPVTRARFDTGNTWMSMPSAVFQKHGHLGELPSVSGLQLMLDNDVTLWFPAPMWSGSVPLANATGFGGLAEDASLEPGLMIIGNEVMKGMIVACDLDNATLGFGGMCAAVHDENMMDCALYQTPEMDDAH